VRDYVYDSGALIAIDSRRDDAAVRRHLNRLTARDHIMVPAPVAAQAVRNPRRQARLMLTLRGCEIIPFSPDDAVPVGQLLARSGTVDVVDGLVALTAANSRATVVTSDPDDIIRLLETLAAPLPVLKP
jgi:predicted nucleic acid-binding protein